MMSEALTGYYDRCNRENYPDPSHYGEVIPGENNGRGKLYYDLEGGCGELFLENFRKAGGVDGKQYGLLLMSGGEKILCVLYDSGSGLPTPGNAQVGLSTERNALFLWGAYSDLGFGEIITGALGNDLTYTAQRLREEYDHLAQSNPLSGILTDGTQVSLYSGVRDKVLLTREQQDDIRDLLDAARYGGRSFEMSEEQGQQRGVSVMSLSFGYGQGEGSIHLYEDMNTIVIDFTREERWIHFDEAVFDAPELVAYIDALSQNGMPKLYELTGIAQVRIIQNDETIKTIDDADALGTIINYFSMCRRKPADNLHGSDYQIVVMAGGVEYVLSPDDNVKDVLVFDGHQYQAPAALMELLDIS